MSLRAALAILARALAVFCTAPLAAVGPCLPLVPTLVAVPRLYRARNTRVSVLKSCLGHHDLPARIATALAVLVCMMHTEALATPEWLRMLMLARAAQVTGMPIRSATLATLAVVVAKETAVSQWYRLAVAEAAVHLAQLAILSDSGAHDRWIFGIGPLLLSCVLLRQRRGAMAR